MTVRQLWLWILCLSQGRRPFYAPQMRRVGRTLFLLASAISLAASVGVLFMSRTTPASGDYQAEHERRLVRMARSFFFVDNRVLGIGIVMPLPPDSAPVFVWTAEPDGASERSLVQCIRWQTNSGPSGPSPFYSSAAEFHGVLVPVWATVAILAMLPSFYLLRSIRHRYRLNRGFCTLCGYDLRASPHACPECGNAAVPKS